MHIGQVISVCAGGGADGGADGGGGCFGVVVSSRRRFLMSGANRGMLTLCDRSSSSESSKFTTELLMLVAGVSNGVLTLALDSPDKSITASLYNE